MLLHAGQLLQSKRAVSCLIPYLVFAARDVFHKGLLVVSSGCADSYESLSKAMSVRATEQMADQCVGLIQKADKHHFLTRHFRSSRPAII
jgi:hypothetical protein